MQSYEKNSVKKLVYGVKIQSLHRKKRSLKLVRSRFKIDQDQRALNAGEAPTSKPVYDNTAPVQGGSGP